MRRSVFPLALTLLALIPRPAPAQGPTDAAATDFEAGRLDKAQAELQAILRARPEDEEAHDTLAKIFVKRGRTAEALREYRLALRNRPNNGDSVLMASPVPDDGPVRAGDAVRAAQERVRLHPDDARAHDALGQAEYEAGANGGDGDRLADVEFGRAMRLDPRLAAPHVHRAVLLTVQARTVQAEVEYKTALRLDPSDAEAHNDYGFTLSLAKRDADALAEFNEALRLRPGYPAARHNLAVLHSARGDALADRGRTEAAVAEYRRAVALEPNPKDTMARTNLALCLRLAGRNAEAAAEYRSALRADPQYGPTHQSLARTLDDLGDLPSAIAEYRESVRLAPQDALWRMTLGLALYQSGDRAGARREWQTARRSADPSGFDYFDAGLLLKQFP